MEEDIIYSNNPNEDSVQMKIDGKYHKAYLARNILENVIYQDNPNVPKALFTGSDGKKHTAYLVKNVGYDDVGANTDLSNLSDTGKANISAKGTYDSGATYDAGTVGKAIQGKANVDMDNLTSTGANIANWSSNVSNCITEIPQDINLTLSAGTLTLKAGSKVYVPNGDGVFDVVNITADKTMTATNSGTFFVFINQSNNLQVWGVSNGFSGTTAPTSVHYPIWYDTTNNIIKSSSDYGSTWSGKFSFPMAIVTVSNGAITSIDQVFNGCGFIGNSVFGLPGVKGMAPNGRNTDGTLKSEVCTSAEVRLINNLTSSTGYTIGLGTTGGLTSFFYTKEYDQETYPGNNYRCWYKPSENKIYNSGTGQGSEIQSICATLLHFNPTTYFFNSKIPFHAVDYDIAFIAHQAMPSDRYTELSTSISSGYSYAAPADGYLSINKSGSDGDWLYMRNTTNGLNIGIQYAGSYNGRLFIPVQKGHVIQVQFQGSGTVNEFRFIYANGVK